MSRQLAGTVAIVTGASSGVGHATARELADRGACVVMVARRRDRLDALVTEIEDAGGTALAVPPASSISVKGLLYMTNAALPHLQTAAQQGPREVADIVNISSIAGRVAWNGYGVYNMTKFGVNGFTEALRQEVTRRHVRVGVLEPGGVATELGSHNSGTVRDEIGSFYETTEVLVPEDIADGIAYMVTRPRHASVGELWLMPTDEV